MDYSWVVYGELHWDDPQAGDLNNVFMNNLDTVYIHPRESRVQRNDCEDWIMPNTVCYVPTLEM